MIFTRSQNGGRRLIGDRPHGRFEIELLRDHDGPVYDGEGNELGTVRLTILEPADTPETREMTAQRHEACRNCPAHTDLTDVSVRCRRRRCRPKLRLDNPTATCPEGRWASKT